MFYLFFPAISRRRGREFLPRVNHVEWWILQIGMTSAFSLFIFIFIALDLQKSRQTIYALKKASVNLSSGCTPKWKIGSGRPRKSSARIESLLKCEVLIKPTITTAETKKKHSVLLMNIWLRPICLRPICPKGSEKIVLYRCHKKNK